MALRRYEMNKVGKIGRTFSEWKVRPETQAKCQSMGVTAFLLWNYHGGKPEETKKYDNLYKENEMARKS